MVTAESFELPYPAVLSATLAVGAPGGSGVLPSESLEG
jgi:hypothetical protein